MLYPDNATHSSDILDLAILKTGSLHYRMENYSTELSLDYTPMILHLDSVTSHNTPHNPSHFKDRTKFESLMNEENFLFNDGSSTVSDPEIKTAFNR